MSCVRLCPLYKVQVKTVVFPRDRDHQYSPFVSKSILHDLFVCCHFIRTYVCVVYHRIYFSVA